MKRFVLVLVILLICMSSGHAYYFRSYQIEDGLSNNSVWAVMQDSKGFLWIGTNDGLNRFDGKSFKIFRNKPGDTLSLGDNFIHYLKEDSKGRFFVGTKKGLYVYDDNFEHFHRVNLNRHRDEDASINYLFETPDGSVWVACHGQGLYLLNSDLSIKKHYTKNNDKNGLPNNFIWTVVQDYVGNVWLGTAGDGLVHLDVNKGLFTKMSDEGHDIKEPIIYSLFCDVDYNLWVGTSSNGLYRFNYRTGKVSNYMNQQAFNIKSIIEYSDKELIMGCDKGLVTFDRKNETDHMLNDDFDNMTDNSIFSIIKDREGAFWIGTYFGGVNYFSPIINTFTYHYNSPKNSSKKNIISSFAEDEDGLIWVGTHNDGLSLFNSKKNRFENEQINVGYHNVEDLYYDNGKLYISLYGQGVRVMNIKTKHIENLSDYPLVKNNVNLFTTIIFKSSQKYFFFGSELGVSKYDPDTKEAVRVQKLSDIPVKNITEDYNGAIWFATHANGIFRMNNDGSWNTYTYKADDVNSIPTNNVGCIHQDSKYRIWAGTEGGGLVLFNPEANRFERVFSNVKELSSGIIYSILDDNDGNVWVTTSGGGLIRIDADLKAIKSFGYLGDIQKIRYNPKAVLKSLDNKLYFGGTNGFIAFNPREIKNNEEVPTLTFTSFQISNKEVVPGENSPLKEEINEAQKVVLERNQSNFSFEFVSLSYISSNNNKYAYFLEGFDTDWTYTTESKAYYTNIPAGEYVFRVKGTNNDGVWSDEKSIVIQVKPSFLVSPFMILLYIMVSVAILAYILIRYAKQVERKNQRKIAEYKTRKEKEIYESKINFFTNIAHEIRTPLSLISAPLESIIVSGDGNDKTKNNLNIIKVNANRLLELINQLLDFRKVEENMFHFNFQYQDILKVVCNVFNQYSQNAKLSGIEMKLNIPGGELKTSIDAEAIYKIVSNLVSNAIKHAKSEVIVSVDAKDANIQVTVKDDGKGIDKKHFEKIFEPFFQIHETANNTKTGSGLGLSLSKSLVEKHNGSIWVESEENNGCLFTLNIPIVDADSIEILWEESEQKNTVTDVNTSNETGLRIVIAEDNNDLREFLVNSLGEDYIVFEARNGVEAFDIIEKENIELVISDIMMPEMDGLQLCNIVKSDVAYSHIPLILLSAKTDTPTKIEGLSKGADVYLEKPFSLEQLKAQINSIIENRNNIRNSFVKSPLQYFKQNTTENTENAEFIEKLNSHILENMSDENFTIDNLSGQFYMSRSNFHKKIKNITGMTPNDYIKLIRLNQSAQLLASGKYKINEVCYMVGFNTPSYFSKCFQEQFGKLPKEFVESI